MKKNIGILGATGLVGSSVLSALQGKAYNLDEIEGIQKFIESLPGEIKQNIVKL